METSNLFAVHWITANVTIDYYLALLACAMFWLATATGPFLSRKRHFFLSVLRSRFRADTVLKSPRSVALITLMLSSLVWFWVVTFMGQLYSDSFKKNV